MPPPGAGRVPAAVGVGVRAPSCGTSTGVFSVAPVCSSAKALPDSSALWVLVSRNGARNSASRSSPKRSPPV
jgi:hypothetical protein